MATNSTAPVQQMPTPAQRRLAVALQMLHTLQEGGTHVFHTGQFSRLEREALLQAGYLQLVIQAGTCPPALLPRPETRPLGSPR